MHESTASDATIRCLERAVFYRFLTTAFRYPGASVADDVRSLLPALVSELSAPESTDIRGHAVDLMTALSGVSSDDLAREYEKRFGHSVRSIVTPYETEYGASEGPFIQARDLADLSGFYRAIGLRMDDATPERPDHIATECEFMQVLARKEAFGHEVGDGDLVEQMRGMQRLFLSEHLGRWGVGFCDQLAQTGGVYGQIGRLGADFLRAEREAFGVKSVEPLVLTRPANGRDDVLACGAPEQEVPASSEPSAFEV